MKPSKTTTRNAKALADPLEILRTSGAAEIDRRLAIARKADPERQEAAFKRRKNYPYLLLHYATRAAAAVLAVGVISWSAVSGIRLSQNRKAIQTEISRFVDELYSAPALFHTENIDQQANAVDSAEDFIDSLYAPKLGGDW